MNISLWLQRTLLCVKVPSSVQTQQLGESLRGSFVKSLIFFLSPFHCVMDHCGASEFTSVLDGGNTCLYPGRVMYHLWRAAPYLLSSCFSPALSRLWLVTLPGVDEVHLLQLSALSVSVIWASFWNTWGALSWSEHRSQSFTSPWKKGKQL